MNLSPDFYKWLSYILVIIIFILFLILDNLRIKLYTERYRSRFYKTMNLRILKIIKSISYERKNGKKDEKTSKNIKE